MVGIQGCETNTSLNDDAPPVSTIRQREEFPAVDTEIGREVAVCAEESTLLRKSGRFSLLKWFRRTGRDVAVTDKEIKETGNNQVVNIPSTTHSLYSSSGSVDTIFSTATVYSFAFHRGSSYSNSIDPDKASVESNLRRQPEYRPFDIENNNLRSTTTTTTHPTTTTANVCSTLPKVSARRRKVNTSGLSIRKKNHVQGKRRAPEPPVANSDTTKSQSNNSPVQCKSTVSSSSTSRRKRAAPQPPTNEIRTSNLKMCSIEPSQGGNDNDLDVNCHQVISNDTLKLQGGVLMAAKEHSSKVSATDVECSDQLPLPVNNLSVNNVTPRPWYKRNISDHVRDSGSFRRDVLKIPTLGKPRDRKNQQIQDGTSFDRSLSKLNFFGRTERHSERKKDDKRKSGLSILTNISELDKEAAAIVQREQARNQASSLARTSTYPEADQLPSGDVISDIIASTSEVPRRRTRALISKFNAISNMTRTRVSVNSTFFTKAGFSKADHLHNFDVARNEPIETCSNTVLSDESEQRNKCLQRESQMDRTKSSCYNNEIAELKQQRSEGWEEKIKRYFPENLTESKKESHHKDVKLIKNPIEVKAQEKLSVERISQYRTEDPSRTDLKEMLKEMKHSLPKRPKKKMDGATIATGSNIGGIESTEQLSNTEILPGSKCTDPGISKLADCLKKLEVRCKPIVLPDRVNDRHKVSSAAQTTANVRKVNICETPSDHISKSGWKLEDVFYTTTGKNVASTKLLRNTFQLIRPRDFACIEAMKTNKGSFNENTYINVIADPVYANTIVSPPAAHQTDMNKGSEHSNEIQATFRPKFGFSQLHNRNEERMKAEDTAGTAEMEIRAANANMNTVAINRLLRKLEGAIASGQHQQAAGLAKELAQLKIHCSVVRQRSIKNDHTLDVINVNMYIEDKLAHQGPIPLQFPTTTTITELKKKVCEEFEIPTNVQRWIIGKSLADNNDSTLDDLQAVDGTPIFLYLVAPELQNVCDQESLSNSPQELQTDILTQAKELIPEESKLTRYEQLVSLENSDVIPNSVAIDCPVCFASYGPSEGVILRDCLHMFCRTCIANTIQYCEDAEVKCPFRDSNYTCESTLQEREIKALVSPEIYEQHLIKSITQAENNAGNNAFHCKKPDCPGWCIYDDNVNDFLCPVCGVNNCLTCQAVHMGKNCREYQEEVRLSKETDQESKRTAAVLEEMVESGEALACPTCAVVLMKKWGCDWLRCSMCKTEICWVTRGPRWGPKGKGDTSGGCKCGENGVKCHPRCNYCH